MEIDTKAQAEAWYFNLDVMQEVSDPLEMTGV